MTKSVWEEKDISFVGNLYRRYSRIQYEAYRNMLATLNDIQKGNISMPMAIEMIKTRKALAERKAFNKNKGEHNIKALKRGNPRKSSRKESLYDESGAWLGLTD